MTSPLSPKAKKAMLFIQGYVATDEFARAPTLLEIAASVSISSKSAAHRLVTELELAGFISRTRDTSRGITILRTLADDRFEEAARAVCAALGHTAPADIVKARQAIVSTLVESQAA